MRGWLLAAGINGTMAMAFGGWSAHGAERVLAPAAVDWVKTGSAYQLWHAVALLAVAALAPHVPRGGTTRIVAAAGLAFCFGALSFSGSLYLLAFGGPRSLVYMTPFGGGLLILGWLLLMISGLRGRQVSRE